MIFPCFFVGVIRDADSLVTNGVNNVMDIHKLTWFRQMFLLFRCAKG